MDELKDKKILFVIDNLSFGGAQKLVLDQINYLNKTGYDVSLLTLIPEKRSSFQDRIQLPKEKVHMFNTKLSLSSAFLLRSFFKKQQYEFIISNLFYSNTLIRLSAIFLYKRPQIIVYEHNVYSYEKSKISLFIDWFFSHITLRIIAVSNEVKKYLITVGHIKSKKIDVIKNGIEFPNISKIERPKKRSEFGVGPSDILVVAVGNVDHQKGHDVLLEAANLIKQKGRSFKYLICGRTKDQKIILGLKEKIEKYNLIDSFKLLGDRTDVMEIVSVADIFVMPSRWEGLSIALLEAMALKKAMVVSEIPSMQTLVTSGQNGLKFDLNDTEDFAKKIIQLASDPVLREKLGMEAFKFVQDFHISNCVRSLLNSIIFSLGKESDTYNLLHQKSEKWSERAKVAVSMINKVQLVPGDEIVIGDFGCGDKKVLKALQGIQDLNFKYLGYDLIPQENGIIKIDFSHQFPDRNFDLVFSLGLIEYLNNINFYFDNLSKKCKYVIFSCIVSDIKKYTKNQAIKNGWINYFSLDDLRTIIARHNFEILEIKILDNGVTYLVVIKNKKLT